MPKQAKGKKAKSGALPKLGITSPAKKEHVPKQALRKKLKSGGLPK